MNLIHIWVPSESTCKREIFQLPAQTSKFAFHAQLFEQFLRPHWLLSGLQECRKLPEIINGWMVVVGLLCASNLMIYGRSIQLCRLREGTNAWTGWWVKHIHIYWAARVVCGRPTLYFQTIFVIFDNLSKLGRNDWLEAAVCITQEMFSILS